MTDSSIHVFVGPSLRPDDRLPFSQFVFHEPVAQGDVYRLVGQRPRAIAIIDGYFERVPAVWHKEILYALSEGIHVFGAASMGALRAAELEVFGMVGSGAVFRAYADGTYTDDDEVALVHGDQSSGYRRVSEALVNLRATLAFAAEEGIISRTSAARLTDHLKSLFYPDRHYAAALRWAARELPTDEGTRLEAFIKAGRLIDQKRSDALELLQRLVDFQHSPVPPLRVPWTFHHTDAWETVRRTFLGQLAEDAPRPPQDSDDVPEQLRERALLRELSIARAKSDGFTPGPRDLLEAFQDLRNSRELSDDDSITRWMKERAIGDDELERFIHDEACVRRTRFLLQDAINTRLRELSKLEAPPSVSESSPEPPPSD